MPAEKTRRRGDQFWFACVETLVMKKRHEVCSGAEIARALVWLSEQPSWEVAWNRLAGTGQKRDWGGWFIGVALGRNTKDSRYTRWVSARHFHDIPHNKRRHRTENAYEAALFRRHFPKAPSLRRMK